MRYKKLVATAEAAAVLFSMFTLCSCTSKKAKSGIYSDDTPWFKVEYSDL